MNLINLIPTAEEITGPVNVVLGDDSSGLTGLVNQIESQDLVGAASSLTALFESSIADTIPAQSSSPFGGAMASFENLSTSTEVPNDLLNGIEQPISELQEITQRVPQIIENLSNAAEIIGSARNGDLSTVVQGATEGLTNVLSTITGPDLAGFDSWRNYLTELADTIRPITESGASSDEIRDQLILAAVGRIRDAIFALAPTMSSLSDDAGNFFSGLLPDVPGFNLEVLHSDILATLSEIRTAAQTGTGDIATLSQEYQANVILLTDQLQAAFDSLQSNLEASFLTPDGVKGIASDELDSILAINIDDYSNVSERLDELFTDIEETVDAVDLSYISDSINGFFGEIQSAIGAVDTAVIQEEISEANDKAEEVLAQAQQVLTQITSQIQGWLGELTGSLDSVITELGETGEDGRFHFFFEVELEELYTKVDGLIQGDPANPGTFSIQGSLEDFSNTFVSLIQDIEQQLLALAEQLEAGKDELSTTLDDVRAEIEAVDPKAVMEQAKESLEQAFQAIGNLEFDPVVDPIIEELEAARDSLAQIDLSSLNDLLKAALKAALDAIQTSNFDRQITQELLKELDELLEEPREVLQSIADKINELLQRVIAISPESLFEPVQEQLDRAVNALDVDIARQLRPVIDSALSQLTSTLEDLNPAQFLQPLQDMYQTLQSSVDQLQPEQLLQPVQAQIDQLAEQVNSVDMVGLLTPVNSVFGNINEFLDSIDPQVLLQPVSEPFDSVFSALEFYQPSTLLAPLTDIMDQISDLTQSVPESVITQIRDLYDEAIARGDNLNPSVLFDTIRGPFEAFQTRFNSLQPTALLHSIQQEYTATLSAVVQADSRDGTSFAVELELSMPTVLFATVTSRYQQYHSRFAAVLDSLDPSDLQEKYQLAQQRMEELLPLAIRDDMTASRLTALLGLMDPTTWIQRLDDIYQRILDKLNLISPSVIIDPLADTYQTLRDAIGNFDIAPVVEMVENIIQRISEIIASISLEEIFAPILSIVDRLKNMVTGLDPSILIDGLSERYENLIGVLDNVAIDSILEALQEAWDSLHVKIAEIFNLENLLEPLLEIFDAISALLGGLDAGELTGVLDDKLTKLRDEMEEALNRTGTAFKQMLAAVPLDGGSVGVGGSIG